MRIAILPFSFNDEHGKETRFKKGDQIPVEIENHSWVIQHTEDYTEEYTQEIIPVPSEAVSLDIVQEPNEENTNPDVPYTVVEPKTLKLNPNRK